MNQKTYKVYQPNFGESYFSIKAKKDYSREVYDNFFKFHVLISQKIVRMINN